MGQLYPAIRRRIVRLLRSPAERRHALVGQARLWKMKREFQIDFLKGHGLRADGHLFDMGCGTLRGGIPLIEYLDEGHYYGFDVRAAVLEEAKKELANARLQHKQPVLLTAPTIRSLTVDRTFDIVWAFSVLIHLSDDILDECIGFAAEHMGSESIFYGNVQIGERRDAMWQGFPAVWRPIVFYQEAASRHGLSIEDIGSLAEVGHLSGVEEQDAQRMLVFRKIK